MVVNTIQKRLTPFNCWKGGNKKKYIVIHDVGVKGQTAEANAKYFSNAYRGASAHYFIDRTSIWQVVDDNDCAWHVGDDKNDLDDGINNHNSIGLEMIVEKDGTIHPETKANTKWLVKLLQSKYNNPNENIVRHFDASGKNCPQYLNKDKKWTEWFEFYKYLTDEVETIGSGTIVSDNELVNDEKVSKPIQPSKPSTTKKEKLAEDGYWGPATTRALQRHYGTTVDGVISGQPKNATTKNIPSVRYGTGGSKLIRAMQKDLRTTVDGVISCPSQMIKALQKRLGTIQDGKVSYPSNVVKAMQKALNNGKF
ncbi:N-acetylmuramoyl-L-alanine amidase [Ureibacillus sp. Re31]|uniref:N-acetylmuramoyl-L-alanine amidase n=1 Tax=Ureibacillus galli TaxID=2762222 RepID=A0ABR8XB34_9BACL|nr:peptidoglycan recognition family protein [Ureibacillus galli]MBD8026407.1 N-acetylmuramoyl-L-alanine amidase [Ureibacillus galli]